jgi:hypothetical protein
MAATPYDPRSYASTSSATSAYLEGTYHGSLSLVDQGQRKAGLSVFASRVGSCRTAINARGYLSNIVVHHPEADSNRSLCMLIELRKRREFVS